MIRLLASPKLERQTKPKTLSKVRRLCVAILTKCSSMEAETLKEATQYSPPQVNETNLQDDETIVKRQRVEKPSEPQVSIFPCTSENIESLNGSVFISHSVGVSRADSAWEYFRKIGAPKYYVAPMVDQSELPFRLLCKKYGAQAAYTPMLHSRLFAEEPKYRREFTTCPEDRPLFVQFCANNPDTLLKAAKLVEDCTDYVDINLGCPQRIAKRGNYGSFLMDNLPLVRSLVEKLSRNLSVPVSCKIRIFPDLQQTLEYAKMLEEAGCSLLAVHGRTRDQKNQKLIRADWKVIKAVRESVKIPVLANGNVRWLEDANECIQETGVEGILSADSLLENPALFSGFRMPGSEAEFPDSSIPSSSEEKEQFLDHLSLMIEYLELCERYPVPMRMIRAHVHKILGPWFRVHTDLREKLNKEQKLTVEWLKHLVEEMAQRNKANPSLKPFYGNGDTRREVKDNHKDEAQERNNEKEAA